VESKYGEHIAAGLRPRDLWRTKRVDLYFQRAVPSVPGVVLALAEALGNRGRVAQYLTSVELVQSRYARARWYGKGYESGIEEYADVLRHEEQVRGRNMAEYFVDVRRMELNLSEARAYMNRRYKGFPEGGIEVMDVGTLVREHGAAGLGALAMVLLPEVEEIAKEELAKNTFDKYRKIAASFRVRKVPVDLRVPADAWRN